MKEKLHEAFEALFNRAMTEIQKNNYSNKDDLVNDLSSIMMVMIKEISQKAFNQIKEQDGTEDKKITQGVNKMETTLIKLLNKRIKVIKKEKL